MVKVKVNQVFRMFLVIVIGVWMIYQLRLTLRHKLQASENGGLVKEEDGTQQMKLGLGRRGLVMTEVEKEGRGIKTNDEGKREDKEVEVEVEDEDGIEQLDEDEGLELMEPLDDPTEENDLQNDDDDDQNADRIEMKTGDDADDSSTRQKKDAIND